MIRLSIQARQALAKLTLPVLIAACFGLMLLGKADAVLAERTRMALADALAPIYVALAEPLAGLRDMVTGTTDLWDMRAQNDQLARRERTPAPLAVDRAGAGRREPAAEGQPPLAP